MPAPEKHTVEETFFYRYPDLFQKGLLLATIKSYQFYKSIKAKLCPFESQRNNRRPDFTAPNYNRVFTMVAAHWDHWAPQLDQSQEYEVSLDQLEDMISQEMRQNRLTQAEAEKLFEQLKLDLDTVSFGPDILRKLHEHPMVTRWLDRRAATNLIEQAFNSRNLRPMTLADLKIQVDAAQLALTTAGTNVTRGADLIYGRKICDLPFPTDLDKLNSAMGGGPRSGSTTLIAGVNGSGKSILAMQLARHYACNGARVVVFTTEQSPDQLLIRMLCSYLRIGIDRFLEVPAAFANLPTEQRRHVHLDLPLVPESVMAEYADQIREFYTLIWPRLFFVDWSKSPMAVYKDFDVEMANLANTGWDPDIVVFDWIGGSLESVRSSSKSGLDTRLLYKEAVETLVAHGKKHNRVMIATAQIGKGKVKDNTTHVRMPHLAECLSMTDNITNFIGISSLKNSSTSAGEGLQTDRAEYQWLCLDKSRFGPGGSVRVKAAFRIQAFLADS
jgi:hypothetical protein